MQAHVLTIIGAAAFAVAATAQDAPLETVFGEAFPGATATFENTIEYDEKTFIAGPMSAIYTVDASETVEGRVYETIYEVAANRSSLEVFRAYERAIADKGFEAVYTCKNEDCGGNIGWVLNKKSLQNPQNRDDQRYGLYQRATAGAQERVAIFVTKKGGSAPERRIVSAVVEAVTTDAEEVDLETFDASTIAAAIAETGSAAVYGLQFETGSATLLPASDTILEQIAAYLTAAPEVSLLVVGHTDNQGGFDLNMELSRDRAASVTAALTERFAVDAGRLSAHGVGYLAPKAPNATEEGRAQNRRVELTPR